MISLKIKNGGITFLTDSRRVIATLLGQQWT